MTEHSTVPGVEERSVLVIARELCREPNASAGALRGALKGMLNLYDVLGQSTAPLPEIGPASIELLARVMCKADGDDPDRYWREYKTQAEAAVEWFREFMADTLPTPTGGGG